MKKRIMEALLSSDNDLSIHEIRWAIANIPNTLENVTVYRHDEESLNEACGFTEDDLKAVFVEFCQLKDNIREANNGRICHSMVVEEVMNFGSPKLIRLFVMRGVVANEQGMHEKFAEILTSLEKLFKSK